MGMNGEFPNIAANVAGNPAPIGNPAVVGLLEQVLAQAKRGEILSLGLVMSAGPGRMTAAATPGGEFEIIAGCLDLQNAILARLKRPSSGLMLPRGM